MKTYVLLTEVSHFEFDKILKIVIDVAVSVLLLYGVELKTIIIEKVFYKIQTYITTVHTHPPTNLYLNITKTKM